MAIKNLSTALILILLTANVVFSQSVTRVYGTVVDAETGEPLPFVDVGFKNTSVGTTTDLDGKYEIETRFPSDSLFANYLGYKQALKAIIKEESQQVNFALKTVSLQLETVEFVVKKGKYSKKNNPAIDLSQKVIENSYRNSLRSLDFYSYKQQEKIRIDINNITNSFKEAPVIREFDFMWDYIDTSDVNGRTYLPFFMRENLSRVYWKKSDNALKERRIATRYTEFEQGVDPQSMTDVIDILYQDIDIYQGQIKLLSNQFVSPFHPSGKDFYRYYILDTTEVNDQSAIQLAFIPAVKGNLGFSGNVWISNDDNFTVLKVDMGVVKQINLNFVRDVRIIQEFEELDGNYVKTKDEVVIDYALGDNTIGMYGTRTLYFKDYEFGPPDDMSVFNTLENVVTVPEAYDRSEDFWEENRIVPLEQREVELYEMINRLTDDKIYKRYVWLGKVLATGYIGAGPVDIGVLATFVSFNDVEGLNLRFGGETNKTFSDKLQLQGSISRAFKTEEWKYEAGLTYTFRDDYYSNPRRFLRFTIERNSEFPGQELDFYSPGNFFLSFQRGDATKMFLSESYNAYYQHERTGYSYGFGLQHKKRHPYGSLEFLRQGMDGNFTSVPDISSTEAQFTFRFAPNEQFIQGRERRTQLFNKYPIIQLHVNQGFDGVLGGQYDYTKVKLNMFKQFEWTLIGSTNVDIEGGKTWGNIPYLLQFIPRGNQTYAYELNSYNLMNFMEFSADQYVSAKVEHYFGGFIFNRIPIIKYAKLREVITVKGIWGSLADDNNPNMNASMIQFPQDEEGNPTTFTFDHRPYVEASFGLTNILKVLRFDIVYRINYHENPNVPSLFGTPGLGLRVKTHVEF